MARTVNVKQAALRKAREKRLALDADRDARDRRVEEATATVLVLLDERAEARVALERLDEQIGAGLKRLVADGVSLAGVAQLVGMDATEVRRLTKLRRTSPDSLAAVQHAVDGQPVGAAPGPDR